MITTLGRTCLTVTRIGLGLAALGRPGYINLGHAADLQGHTDVRSMERAAHAVLDAAYAGGVRYFDAARSYGRAEAFLGSWLVARGFGREDVTVGSKWGYTYTADWRVDAEVHEVKDLSAGTFRRQLAETRELLGDHLCLYQIHSATLESGVLDDAEVRSELASLRSTGVFIGLTTSGPRQAETIERALEAAHAAGVGVIIKEALANGRLTARGGVPELDAAALAVGATPDAVALAAVLAQPWVDVALSGATTVWELQSNLAAVGVEPDVSRFDGLVEDPDTYWETRSELPWN